MRDGWYVMNCNEHKSVGTPRIVFYVNENKVTFFHSFGVAHIPKGIKMFIGNKIVDILVLDLLTSCLKV